MKLKIIINTITDGAIVWNIILTPTSRREEEKRARLDGNDCCPQPHAFQNIFALTTLQNCIKSHRARISLWREFHQVGAKSEKALVLVEAGDIPS